MANRASVSGNGAARCSSRNPCGGFKIAVQANSLERFRPGDARESVRTAGKRRFPGKRDEPVSPFRTAILPPWSAPGNSPLLFPTNRVATMMARKFLLSSPARRRRSVTALAVMSFVTAAAAPLAAQSDRERVMEVTRPTNDFSKPERFERRPGGAATVFRPPNRNSFSHPSGNMAFERQLDFRVGNGIFKKLWVSAPSSTASSDGLGPLFNARSCQRCHLKDGRGHPPAAGERAESMFLRLSIPVQNADKRKATPAAAPEPTYGTQLQNFSVRGVPAEGDMTISYREIPVALSGGETAYLRDPAYGVSGLSYGPLHPQTMLSPRVAPPVIGMGLLEAVPEADILSQADPDDADGDGISGRPNRVWSDEHQKAMLGRFGWKAAQPTVAQQTASAFLGDIGISTPLYPSPAGGCTPAQEACRAAPHGSLPNGAEASARVFRLVVFYTRNLGVPARRDIDAPQVLEGKRLFYEANCIGCHRPKFVTRRDSIGEEQSFQLIWPYTDLLLHDMGEGLADRRPEGEATGREWRTPPLWGIGLTQAVNGHTLFLHDGRARNLLEAILWHGGEAQAAKESVIDMTREERAALLAFLNSL